MLGRGFVEDVVGHSVAENAAAFIELEAGLLGYLSVRRGAVKGDALSDVVVIYRLERPSVMHLSIYQSDSKYVSGLCIEARTSPTRT